MFLDNLLLFFINIIHIAVILFVVLTPFTNNVLLLLLYLIVIPFIMLHWLVNNDTCAITIMEKVIRSQMKGGAHVNDQECISYKIIGPVYNFMNDYVDYSTWVWSVTLILWCITLYKLFIYYKSDKLNTLIKCLLAQRIRG